MSEKPDLRDVVVDKDESSKSPKSHKIKKGKSRRPKEDIVAANCDIQYDEQSSPKKQREKYLVSDSMRLDLTTLRKDDEDSEGLIYKNYSPDTIQAYEKTLKEWRQKGAKMAYIYDYVTDVYRKKLKKTGIAAFVLTSLVTLLALSNLGLSADDYPTIEMVLKGSNAVLATAAAICTGIPRILNWGQTKDTCQEYLGKVENLISSVMSEQSLPLRFRTDPEQYILENKEKYEMILNSAPHVSHDDYETALELYEQVRSKFGSHH